MDKASLRVRKPLIKQRLTVVGERPRELSHNLPNRNAMALASSTPPLPHPNSRSGTSTPEISSAQTTSTTTIGTATTSVGSSVIPNEVKEHLNLSIDADNFTR